MPIQPSSGFEPFVSLVAAGNLPPEFVSPPVTSRLSARRTPTRRPPTDPNVDTLTYRVTSGPSIWSSNSATGLISWTPTPDQTGLFQFVLEADDGFGGVATQTFQVQVFASYPNRPPVFQSAPQTLVPTGTNYVYQPVVDRCRWRHAANSSSTPPPPVCRSMLTTGRVEFPNAPAGNYQVTLRAEDGQGGRTTQTYVLTVGPGTASGTPQIVSTPPVLGVVGELYLYQPTVVDPLTNNFVFTLPQSPSGMTINSVHG